MIKYTIPTVEELVDGTEYQECMNKELDAWETRVLGEEVLSTSKEQLKELLNNGLIRIKTVHNTFKIKR